jgi:phosphoribosylglycinamide formyltransferase-1
MRNKINLAIFGSGKGSNAINIINYFKAHSHININVLASDKARRGFLDISYEYRINLEFITGNELIDKEWTDRFIDNYQPDLIILAGFLQLIPQQFIQRFPDRIINIHPSLLPDFGGKGMYGMRVHEAVINSEKKQSGITVHYINENYDEGKIIFQAACNIDEGETATSLAKKIHALEHKHFPQVIENLINTKFI